MKILYIITKSNWGGAQKYVYEMATAFAALGNEVSVAYGGQGELHARFLHNKNIELYPLASLQKSINPFKEFKAVYELCKLIRECKPDILHLNSSKVAGLGALLGRICGVKKIIVTIHGAPFREEDRYRITRMLIAFLTWFSCAMAHDVITVSKKDEFDIARYPFLKKKTKTIYLGLQYEAPQERKKKGNSIVQIVTIAELTPNKGILYALSAIDILIKRGAHIHYTIIGEGSSRKDVERVIHMKQLEPYVTLRGHVPDAAALLNEFDLFVLPSIKEGLPYVLLEAGKAMIPVVATITGGIPEIIMHEKTGLLVLPKDVEGLAYEIERMITSKDFSTKMTHDLREHVVGTFSKPAMIAQTAKVYGTV